MKKIVLFILGLFLTSSSITFAEADAPLVLPRIDFIKIHVKSRKAEFIHNLPEGGFESRFYKVATPTVKEAKKIPFGVVGEAYKIILNPRYIPTSGHLAKEKGKGNNHPKKLYLPGDEDNPLGLMKLYCSFSGKGIDPDANYGLHATNNPKSVGTRASEGCARISNADAYEVFGIILRQNRYDAEALFEEAKTNPRKSIKKKLQKKDRPKIVYLND